MKPGKFRIVITATGVLLVAVAILSDTAGFSSGDDFGYGQAFTVSAGVLLVLAGIFGNRFIGGYKSVSIMLLNSFLLLALVEFSSLIVVKLIGTERVFAGQRELLQSHTLEKDSLIFPDFQYHPFVMWKSAELDLSLMNVDSDGTRRTCGNPESPSVRIFMLGGSAVWGWMVPDSCTIPSVLQEVLKTTGYPGISVTNLGQNGWVSTQEITQLVLKLNSGEIPDMVIFYDGANDMLASVENGEAGLVIGNQSTRRRFQGCGQGETSRCSMLSILGNTNCYRLIRYLTFDREELFEADPVIVPVSPRFADTQFNLKDLAAETCDIYLGNYRIAEALADEYGFEFYYVLQPLMNFQFDDESLEGVKIPGAEDRSITAFAEMVYGEILARQNQYPRLIYAQQAFTGGCGDLFMDLCHLNADGNEVVASWIVSVLRENSLLLFETAGAEGTI
ncbi:MAG: SGNH/GDSL hydrolase family protein [Candidatus Fermentibacteraceae bacterium]|nr:SGNH/GDSL hydrolase family protein [Candidatus Fermentibacteraceae bacterium]